MSEHLKPIEWKGQSRKPMIAKCSASECGFVWPIAYLPMEIPTIAPLMIDARCPMCGSSKPFAA